jgi:alpha,alpha-trehalose-phosphate synthase [UDP-forming]
MLNPHNLPSDRDLRAAAPSSCAPVTHATSTFIVANRLPVEYHSDAGWRPSPGGLVSALEPALQNLSAVWVGWRGSAAPDDSCGSTSTRPPRTANIAVIEIPITRPEMSCFYDGVCNAAFWPLYHDAVIDPVFRDEEFEVYRRINQRFADCVAGSAPAGALVWVHDYQLQLVPALLREARPDLRIGFFLHVPFPASAEFDALPWKESVLRGLLGADLIGFQTALSAERFIDEACRRVSATRDGRGVLLREAAAMRRVMVDAFPIGPDAGRFSGLAATPAVRESAARIRADLGAPELILLGVDRLDYTKGIDLRIRVVADLLKSDEFRGRDIQFIQVAMPSRSDLASYQQLRANVEETLRAANAELAALGCRPIQYINEALPTEQVVELYVAADVMLVTSLADGMNLVSKEFVACREDGSGRLVLSSTTGAAVQLHDAWLVDPGDVDDLKRGIGQAIRAGADEARDRMGRLRQAVFNADARRWAESFLGRLHKIR